MQKARVELGRYDMADSERDEHEMMCLAMMQHPTALVHRQYWRENIQNVSLPEKLNIYRVT